LRTLEPPLLQRVEARSPHGCNRVACNPVAELLQESARLAVPRQEEMPARARDADVQQPPLLVLVAAADRQLALLETRDEHSVELEPLRAVQRQQVDAAARARAEALVQRGAEVRARAVERRCQPNEPPQVRLPRVLAVSQPFGWKPRPPRRRRPAGS